MILIHTALLCEAQSFIEYYKLNKTDSNPKIYANDTLIICISGVGEDNTIQSLNYIFKNFTIEKAFNIGIAGCNNAQINIGSLYSINRHLKEIQSLPLITSNNVITNSNEVQTTLYDMEGLFFNTLCLNYLSEENIYIFKVVSDHLSNEKLSKDYIKSLISKQTIIHKYINLN